MPRLFARGSDGVVCIHTGADDVVSTPTADLSRVLFHSNLDYPSIVSTHTTSVTLPARTAITYANFDLFAHGQAGTPFIIGYITNLAAVPVTFAGSVPVDAIANSWFARWVTLGANSTHVVLNESTIPSLGLPARTLNITVLVTDLLL